MTRPMFRIAAGLWVAAGFAGGAGRRRGQSEMWTLGVPAESCRRRPLYAAMWCDSQRLLLLPRPCAASVLEEDLPVGLLREREINFNGNDVREQILGARDVEAAVNVAAPNSWPQGERLWEGNWRARSPS